MLLKSSSGYNISYKKKIPKNPKMIVIAMHGFLGDKESGCISLLQDELYKMGIGLIKFDWPGHGESETDGFKLRVANCLNDLNSIVLFLKREYKDVDLIAFSTSFAGYITLLYNYYYPNTFKHIILRCPAIKMGEIFLKEIETPNIKNELMHTGYFKMGYERITEITQEFIDDLKNNDAFNIYKNKKLDYISIIHGTNDDIVPIDDSILFANKHNAHLYTIVGADHRFKNDGELDKVINISKDIINNIKTNN